MNEYLLNKETGKIELHFEKEDYLSLSDDQKNEIKSNFLFSKRQNAWISRCKFPNLYRAKSIAEKLGLKDAGTIGETLSFEEQMQRKAERAERRAERYEDRSVTAETRGHELQAPIEHMHGDIAFFTQPNINSSSGRAFTHRREKMFAAWERGFEEFKKSEYYAERANIARQTAKNASEPTDKGFCDRRIKEAEKAIRDQQKNLDTYKNYLEQLESGKEIRRYNGDMLTIAQVNEWIDTAEELIDQNISKSVYYHECMERLGGNCYSKDNIKPGYIVHINRWGDCRILSTGPVNVIFEIMRGGAAGSHLKAAYAEIDHIVSTDITEEELPFVVGETFTIQAWNGNEYADKVYTVTKVANGKVTLKSGTERAVTKKPRKFKSGNGYSYAIGMADGLHGTIYKQAAI